MAGAVPTSPVVEARAALAPIRLPPGTVDRIMATATPTFAAPRKFPVPTVDEALLLGIAQRDRDAFAEFYDRYAPRLLNFLKQMLGSLDDAEDVLQETFWQVWRSGNSYVPGLSTPETWLFMIARSRALDRLRTRQWSPEPQPMEMAYFPTTPLDSLVRDENYQSLHTALGQLPIEQRMAVSLAFFNDQSHSEIAASLAIPLGTAKTRIALGMKRLRGILRPMSG